MKSNTKMMLGFLVGALVFGGIGGYAANVLSSRDVTYTSNNPNFKAGNVGDALDTLYDSVDVTKILPVGSVISYMGTSAPDHYLICDGTTYNIADYQKLADHIKNNFGSYNYFGGNGTTTFAVPDLRGEFLRGAGTNSHANQGSGATVGVHQNGTEHRFLYLDDNSIAYRIYQGSAYDTLDSYYGSSNTSARSSIRSTWAQNASDGVYTSRPTNTSVTYIIKVK